MWKVELIFAQKIIPILTKKVTQQAIDFEKIVNEKVKVLKKEIVIFVENTSQEKKLKFWKN